MRLADEHLGREGSGLWNERGCWHGEQCRRHGRDLCMRSRHAFPQPRSRCLAKSVLNLATPPTISRRTEPPPEESAPIATLSQSVPNLIVAIQPRRNHPQQRVALLS